MGSNFPTCLINMSLSISLRKLFLFETEDRENVYLVVLNLCCIDFGYLASLTFMML